MQMCSRILSEAGLVLLEALSKRIVSLKQIEKDKADPEYFSLGTVNGPCMPFMPPLL